MKKYSKHPMLTSAVSFLKMYHILDKFYLTQRPRILEELHECVQSKNS